MTTTAAMLTAMAQGLETEITTAREVFIHGGAWTGEEIARYYANAPALAVTQFGFEAVRATPTEPHVRGQFAVFAVSKNSDRRVQAQTMVDQIVAFLCRGTDWGLDDASRPTNVRAENLYSSDFDRKGLSVFLVSWEQEYMLDFSPSYDDLDDLTLVYTEYALIRETDDEVDLPADGFDADDNIELEAPE